MSQENIEVVRRVFEAEAKRDRRAVVALYDTDVEIDCSRVRQAASMGSDTYRGYKGLRLYFSDWHKGWRTVEGNPDELIDSGEEVISVLTRQPHGKAPATDTELHVALVWTIREGQVARVIWYPSRAEAIEAASAEL